MKTLEEVQKARRERFVKALRELCEGRCYCGVIDSPAPVSAVLFTDAGPFFEVDLPSEWVNHFRGHAGTSIDVPPARLTHAEALAACDTAIRAHLGEPDERDIADHDRTFRVHVLSYPYDDFKYVTVNAGDDADEVCALALAEMLKNGVTSGWDEVNEEEDE